ncbi:hypothetical protein ACA30_05920 [Virgibacillus soli]|nr:hypothetical protein ACA30_05920 [Virgibacillus soli]
MTIFTTICVPEGIVMTSDSRLTQRFDYEDGSYREFALSNEEQKIFLVKNNEIGITYTSNRMRDGFRMPEFISRFNQLHLSQEDSVKSIATKLNDCLINEEFTGSIVVAGYDDNLPFVFLLENNEVTLLNRNEDEEIIFCITRGGKIDRINDVLDKSCVEIKELSLNQALELGIELTQDSIDYYNSLPEYSNIGGTVSHLTIQGNQTTFVK